MVYSRFGTIHLDTEAYVVVLFIFDMTNYVRIMLSIQ